MELHVVLPDESPSMPVDTLVDLARAAEELGYSAAWLPDHVLPPGEYGATFGGVYEPLVTIGHLAAVTERLQLGTSVLVAPLRDPFVLAKQIATLHRLSAGRVTLGLGVGWNEQEFDALGADYRHRGAITDDILELLRHLFSGGTAPYQGRRFSYEHGVFAPIPDGGVPIMVGGNSDAALRRAARYGDIWQGLPASPRAFAERARRLAELAADRDIVPALRIGWDGTTPVERVADDVIAYRDAGAAQVAVHFGEYQGTFKRMEALADALTGR
ncbi:TIGR03619 family F420-dependent LLM class oxidoreductase [Phytoactinopolyspora alkaliphila]|uniref:TIGR03619 family F420-dependent LLM class oxidoreductase n=1 Tax=Phytoactinopolyspora alkaliphila TaxID=1783498 RepID=A0A6N9YSG6_9ACTN|nr:TIGR03619 family F420-dependent LLM class oxidoreductase [Phytoactinopolyspora alkaliphila]NED97895.1 TIGR03619 family F420-dependent LLM class oxidoreductase [Phytoactinopolyspora alkaliphila]